MNAESTGRVGSGRDYTAFVALASDHDRLTFQRWIEQLFHRDEEGVHVNMENGSGGRGHSVCLNQNRLRVELPHLLINPYVLSSCDAPGKVFTHAVAHQPLPRVRLAIYLHSLMDSPQQSFSGVFHELEAGSLLSARVPRINSVVEASGGADNRDGAVL